MLKVPYFDGEYQVTASFLVQANNPIQAMHSFINTFVLEKTIQLEVYLLDQKTDKKYIIKLGNKPAEDNNGNYQAELTLIYKDNNPLTPAQKYYSRIRSCKGWLVHVTDQITQQTWEVDTIDNSYKPAQYPIINKFYNLNQNFHANLSSVANLKLDEFINNQNNLIKKDQNIPKNQGDLDQDHQDTFKF